MPEDFRRCIPPGGLASSEADDAAYPVPHIDSSGKGRKFYPKDQAHNLRFAIPATECGSKRSAKDVVNSPVMMQTVKSDDGVKIVFSSPAACLNAASHRAMAKESQEHTKSASGNEMKKEQSSGEHTRLASPIGPPRTASRTDDGKASESEDEQAKALQDQMEKLAIARKATEDADGLSDIPKVPTVCPKSRRCGR